VTTQDIAEDFVALCRLHKFTEAGEKYWAEDVVSVESMGDTPDAHGKAALHAKGNWWFGAHDIHSVEVGTPYINGDQFIVRFTIDVTIKESGQRMNFDEVGLYTLHDGLIVEERFFAAV